MTARRLPRARALLRDAVPVGVLAAFGYLVAGLLGVGVAMAAQAALRSARARPWHVLAAAACLLALAGVATVVEAPHAEADIGTNFAVARPLASRSGLLAGVLLAATLVEALPAQRAPAPVRSGRRRRRRRWRRALPVVPTLIAVGLGAAMSATLGPEPLSPVAEEIATNVESGAGYGRGASPEPSALTAPLGPIVGGLGPGAPAVQLAVVVGLASGATVGAARRLTPKSPWVQGAAGVIVAVSPWMWGQQLPTALATLAIAVALGLTSTGRIGNGRAAGAGAMLGLATLAVPWAAASLAVIRPRGRRSALVVFLIATAAVVLPWLLWVNRHFDTWQPTTDGGRQIAAASAPAATGGSAIGTQVLSTPPPPGTEQAALDAAWDSVRTGPHFQPQVIGARMARSWDLWSPPQIVDDRSRLAQPNPGGSAAIIATWVITGLAVAGLAGRDPSDLEAVARLPVLLTLLTGVTYANRGAVALAAPVVAILAAVGARSGAAWLRERFRAARFAAAERREPQPS